MYPQNIREEELKNKVAQDFFNAKDLNHTKIIGNIDFCVSFNDKSLFESINFLFAEAKAKKADYRESITQLILTLGKNKILEHTLPPTYFGAFDCEEIVFLPYEAIASYLQDLFSRNDFNWRLTPSDYQSSQFKQVFNEIKDILESNAISFNFNDKALKEFIKLNFTLNNDKTHKIAITKNNFNFIYYQWCKIVKPTIKMDWEDVKPEILDSDFYLADILSIDNTTQEIKQNLRILLKKTFYKVKDEYIKKGSQLFATYIDVNFTDNQKAHNQFWNIYERPPKEEFWDYILERRDLLVPVDIRERKGAFFTPQVWVRKSQEYLQNALGEDYQEEYYIWDCAAGTGNLLVGLSEKYRIFASTLDKSDVDIMLDLYGDKTLLKSHIFQFDFLNDPLPCVIHKERQDGCFNCCNFDEKNTKIPQTLIKILKDPKEREKLIIYINPPYAEAGTTAQTTGTGSNKSKVATDNATYLRYKDSMGKASNELFAQFFFRIYKEIEGCTLASFSTLKYINSSNFIGFREAFKAKFLSGFICPAYTFDNVKGSFPIGFLIWDLSKKE